MKDGYVSLRGLLTKGKQPTIKRMLQESAGIIRETFSISQSCDRIFPVYVKSVAGVNKGPARVDKTRGVVWRRVAFALPSRCLCVASVLPPRCLHVAFAASLAGPH